MLSQKGGTGNGSMGGTVKGIFLSKSPDIHSLKAVFMSSSASVAGSAITKTKIVKNISYILM